MDTFHIATTLLGVGGLACFVLAMVVDELNTRRSMLDYWTRGCTGRAWLLQFPGVPKDVIRDYLGLFADAWAFRAEHRLKFRPEDRLADIERACLSRWDIDGMGWYEFTMMIEERFGKNLYDSWSEEITLGDVLAMALGEE